MRECYRKSGPRYTTIPHEAAVKINVALFSKSPRLRVDQVRVPEQSVGNLRKYLRETGNELFGETHAPWVCFARTCFDFDGPIQKAHINIHSNEIFFPNSQAEAIAELSAG
jgi:hypothetical protein